MNEVVDPVATDPTVVDPGVTDPTVVNPGIPDPSVVDPGAADPSVVDPGVTDPSLMDSSLQQPAPDPIIYDIKKDVLNALNDWYDLHIKVHVEGSIQIFHSLTLGEAAICILLAAILLIMIFKWIWEVLRYA